METGKVIRYEDYLRLLWWSAIGFKQILDGGDAKEIAEKHLKGVDKLLDEVECGKGVFFKKK